MVALPSLATCAAAGSPSAGLQAAAVGGPLEQHLERFLDGEPAAFEAIYQHLAPRLHKSLGLLTGDAHLASDLVQTTFLKVIRAARTWQRGMSVEAWVWAIARNALADERRRRSRRGETLTADPALLESVPAEAPAQASLGPSVERALGQLPEAQREALLLLKVHDLSAKEAAAALGTTVGAIKMRAQRACESLRRLLTKEREP